jgi:hypothetical protein
VVKKDNRKVIGAICLLLAAKINDPKEVIHSELVDTFERVLEIPKKEIYSNEFSVYAALEFQLCLPLIEISPHMNRILSLTSEAVQPFIENKNQEQLVF